MKKNTLLLVSFLLTVLLVSAQGEWKLNRSDNGIDVYTRKADNSNFKSVKVECKLTGTIDKLINILKNVDGNKKWVYNTKLTKMIRTVSSSEFIYYAETSLPWPLSNRDMVINMLFTRDSVQKTLTVKATGMPGEIATKSGLVRIPYFNGLWEVATIDDTHISITYFLSIDPGGSVPAWAYNKFVAKGPYNTFNNLAELLRPE
ncbi:MAG: START domain-containing protein [Ferruginibacter sp.]